MASSQSNKRDFLFGSHFFPCESGSYFERTSRPIYAITYLLFFIVFYEIAVFFMSPDLLTRPLDEIPGLVVAFAWIHNFLTWLGLSSESAWMGAPMAFIIVLVAMQITSRSGYRVRFKDFLPMTLECLGWAIPLIVFGLLFGRIASPAQYSKIDVAQDTQKVVVLAAQEDADSVSQQESSHSLILEIVTGIGAGIYEELIFRLILIWLLLIFFKDLLGFSSSIAVLYAILISSFLFSLHHHFYFLDGHVVRSEKLVPIIFAFRMLAGAYLAVIFAFRGIGISAATHIYHNIIVALLNSYVFATHA